MARFLRIITLLVFIVLFICISMCNTIQWLGINKGFYIDVPTRYYLIYQPLETITNGYIQVDSNE